MHVLATELATLEEADVAVDLGQSPAEIVVLSFSDSDLSALAAAWQQDADVLPTLRLASLKRLKHPMSVDLYVDSVVARARLVIVRCLGGLDYWRYGLEHIADVARDNGVLFAALPGDDRADARLASVSTLAAVPLVRFERFFREGGVDNLRQALRYAATLLGRDLAWTPPAPVGPLSLLGDPVAAGRPAGCQEACDHPQHHRLLGHARGRHDRARRRRCPRPAGRPVRQHARGMAKLAARPVACRSRHERCPARARRTSADTRHLLQGRSAGRSAARIRQRASPARARSRRLRRAPCSGLGAAWPHAGEGSPPGAGPVRLPGARRSD